MSESSATLPTVRSVPLAALRTFPELFVRYCTDYDTVADFYAGDFRRPAARRAAAERAAAHPRDRDGLADVLLEQNEWWGLPEAARANIEALRDPEAVAVVTGQQVGLLTGPLYTIYKTITVLQLADALAEETGRPVVPIFWIEGEDHDFGEIARTHVLQHNALVSMAYDPLSVSGDGNPGAVGRLALTDRIEPVLDALDEALPPSDFKAPLLEHVRAAYRPGTALEDAFAKLVRTLFLTSGLVFINPDDARLKRQAAPLFRREIEDYATAHARIEAASDALREDYHVQVRARPTNLFLLGEQGRVPIDADGDGFVLRPRKSADRSPDTHRTFTAEALLDRLGRAPEQFSPNVVLRPLMQDALLPTAAYVAGPSEVSYFAQYKGVYAWAGIPMPIIYPRASVTLAESKVTKVLDKYDLDIVDVAGDVEPLFQRLVVEAMEVDVDAMFEEAMRTLHEAINTLKPAVEQVDRTLARSAEATRAALVKEMEELRHRVVRAEKRNQDEVHAQLEKARANLFPQGVMQERIVSVLYFLNKYSPDLLDELREALALDTTAHQVVEL